MMRTFPAAANPWKSDGLVGRSRGLLSYDSMPNGMGLGSQYDRTLGRCGGKRSRSNKDPWRSKIILVVQIRPRFQSKSVESGEIDDDASVPFYQHHILDSSIVISIQARRYPPVNLRKAAVCTCLRVYLSAGTEEGISW